MKQLMLLACWAIIVLSPTKLTAQSKGAYIMGLDHPKVYEDTIEIRLQGTDRVFFVGADMEKMAKYQKADSIKTLFLNDWQQAVEKGSVDSSASEVYYFVSEGGKRRLKAESPEFTETKVDPSEEMRKLSMDLPKYTYTVYDMSSGYRFIIYGSDPSRLMDELANTSFDRNIAEAGKVKKDVRKNYKLNMDGSTYAITGRQSKRHLASIEAVPLMGAAVLENRPVPGLGGDIYFRANDKYGSGLFKAGVGIRFYPLVEMSKGEVTDMKVVQFYDLQLKMNVNETHGKETWLGIHGGLIDSDAQRFKNTWQFGFSYDGNGPFNYSIDFIGGGKKGSPISVSIWLPF